MDDEDNNGEASESEDERGGLPLPPQFALESPAANVQNIGPVVGPDGQKGMNKTSIFPFRVDTPCLLIQDTHVNTATNNI